MTDRPETERVDALATAALHSPRLTDARYGNPMDRSGLIEWSAAILAALTELGWSVERRSEVGAGGWTNTASQSFVSPAPDVEAVGIKRAATIIAMVSLPRDLGPGAQATRRFLVRLLDRAALGGPDATD